MQYKIPGVRVALCALAMTMLCSMPQVHAQSADAESQEELGAATGRAAAQQAADAPAETETGAQRQRAGALEEIVVTARRREERSQDVPAVVTALSGDALRSAQITTAKDLVAQVPSLNVNTGNSREGNRFTIRGQGTTLSAGEGVSVYLAEAPMPQFGAGAAGLYYDLQNLQVLNGPQGTLFGRNTTGGAVLFTPNRPTDINEGYAELGAGNYGNREASAMINWAALPGRLSLRLAGQTRERDGYTRNLNDGRDYDSLDNRSYRFSALYTGERFENYLLVTDTRSEPSGTAIMLTHVNPAGAAAFFYPELPQYLEAQQARDIRTTDFDSDAFFLARTFGIIDTATLTLSDTLTLKNIFGYFRSRSKNAFDIDGSPAPTVVYFDVPDVGNPSAGGLANTRYYSDELQLSGTGFGGLLNWVTGLFYLKYEPIGPSVQQFTQFGTLVRLTATEEGTTQAWYGQGTLALGGLAPALDAFSVTAGYRYTQDEKQVSSDNANLDNETCQGQPDREFPDCTRYFDEDFSKSTYTLSVDWRVRPGMLLYVTHRTGYKAGGFNANSEPGQPFASFGPEQVKNYELGVKADFVIAGMPLRANLAVFQDSYEDIQRNQTVTVPDSDPPRLNNVVLNAAEATIKGLELQAMLDPFDGLRLQANYSYLDTAYDRFMIGALDLSGEPLPYAPRHKIGASARYRLPLAAAIGDVDLGLSYSYQDRFRFSDVDQPGNEMGRYGLYNLDASWRRIAGSAFDAELFVTNLSDKEYVQQSFAYYNSIGTSAAFYGEPRMYGLRLRYHFGG